MPSDRTEEAVDEPGLRAYLAPFLPAPDVDLVLDVVRREAARSALSSTLEGYVIAHSVLARRRPLPLEAHAVVLVAESGLDPADVARLLRTEELVVRAAVEQAWSDAAAVDDGQSPPPAGAGAGPEAAAGTQADPQADWRTDADGEAHAAAGAPPSRQAFRPGGVAMGVSLGGVAVVFALLLSGALGGAGQPDQQRLLLAGVWLLLSGAGLLLLGVRRSGS